MTVVAKTIDSVTFTYCSSLRSLVKWLRQDGEKFESGITSIVSERRGRNFTFVDLVAERYNVLTNEGEKTGYLIGHHSSGVVFFARTFVKDKVAGVGTVITASEHRGKGLCTRGMTVLIETIRGVHRNVEHVLLNVRKDNEVARRCYVRAGFTLTGQEKEIDGVIYTEMRVKVVGGDTGPFWATNHPRATRASPFRDLV